MPSFTSNLGLSEEIANPSVGKIYQPTGGTLSSTGQGVSDNPLEQLANALSGGSIAGGGGDYGDPFVPISPSPISPISPISPTPGTPFEPSPVTASASGGGGDYGMFTDPYAQYGADADWYKAQDVMTMGPWEQAAMQFVPFGTALTTMQKMSLGINPFAGAANFVGGMFSDDYYSPTFGESYGGPGTAAGNVFGLTPGQQRDMIIQQELDLWSTPQEEADWYSDTTGDASVSDMEEADYTQEDINFITEGFDSIDTVEATPLPPSTLEEAVEQGLPFGKEGDDSWSPGGGQVFHGPGYNWNTGGTTDTGGDSGGASEEAGSASDSNMADAGFSQADQDFIDSGFDDDTSSDSGGGDGGGGGGSYIATATTQALGEEGLKVFEDWRDYMASVYPTFTASYGRYRVTAPKIVAEIDKKDNSKNIYSWIWDMHLKPIFDLIIRDKDSKKAQKDYKLMVRELSKKFLSKGEKK